MNKTIVLLVSNLKGGGAQRVVSNLSKILSADYRLFICLHDVRDLSYPFHGKLIDLQIPPANNWLSKIVNFIKRIIKFKKIRHKINPDYVLSFMESSNFVNLLSGRVGKSIISVRNYKSKQGKGFTGITFNLLMKLIYNRSSKIVAASQGIKEDLIHTYQLDQSKISVIYNPVDLLYIREMSAAPLEKDYEYIFNHPVVITSGKMMKQKGQWHLIRAFSMVKRNLPDVKLVILGDGFLRSHLVSLIQSLGLKDDIKLLGFQENPFKFVYRASIFVLPSLYEGFPNVLLEAMACGVPVIASDCRSGPREILAPETDYSMQTDAIEFAKYGVLVPVCNGELSPASIALTKEEEYLAESIIKLYNNQSQCMLYKQLVKERINDFNLQQIAMQWIEQLER
jgi:glycosyltransferase involved in cell wall biosynthesis